MISDSDLRNINKILLLISDLKGLIKLNESQSTSYSIHMTYQQKIQLIRNKKIINIRHINYSINN